MANFVLNLDNRKLPSKEGSDLAPHGARNHRKKRSRLDSGNSNPDNTQAPFDTPPPHAPTPWPRFLVIEATDKERPLDKLSPFAIAKGIQGLAGEPKMVKHLRSGSLLVEVENKAHATNLIRSQTLVDRPVRVSAHRSLNSSKGVIRCPILKNTTEEEITENLKNQGVESTKRIKIKKNGELRDTNSFILTFNTPKPPTSMKIAYSNLIVEVQPYIPNPTRCFQCQRLGHHKGNCRRQEACANCGKEDHNSNSCDNAAQCVNCHGDHPAYSKQCPKWRLEKEIIALKTTSNLSFVEARKQVEARTPTVSYAEATRTGSAAPQHQSQNSCQKCNICGNNPFSKKQPTPAINTPKSMSKVTPETTVEKQQSPEISNKHATITPKAGHTNRPKPQSGQSNRPEKPPLPAKPKLVPAVKPPKTSVATPQVLKLTSGVNKILPTDAQYREENKIKFKNKKKNTGGKTAKGVNDPVAVFNRYGDLDMETNQPAPPQKQFDPILPPDK
ncbi:MAG: hypothetical protein ABFS03_09390 [Chloroflexota bacterium]